MQTFYPRQVNRSTPSESYLVDHDSQEAADLRVAGPPSSEQPRELAQHSSPLHCSKRQQAERPAGVQASAQSSLYARNATWGKSYFGAVGNHGGGPRAAALDAQIRRTQDANSLRKVLATRVFEFDAGHMVGALARTANFATGSGVNEALLPEAEKLMEKVDGLAHELDMQDIVVSAWSLAKLPCAGGTSLWYVLSSGIDKSVSSFSPQQLANISWSLARLGRYDESAWGLIAQEAVRRVHHAAGAELSMTLWAFANHGAARERTFPELFKCSASIVHQKVSELSPTSLANISWAFAKHGCDSSYDPSNMFSAICTRASQIVANFSGWEISTIVWAFVTVQVVDEILFSKFAARVSTCSLTLQNASSLAWAFAAAGVADELLFKKITSCLWEQLDNLDAGAASRFAWAYGSLEINDTAVLDLLADFAKKNATDFATHDLSSLATGFVRVAHLDSSMFEALKDEAVRRLPSLGPLELSNLLWALSATAANGGAGGMHPFFGHAETALLANSQNCEPESLSTAVTTFRRIGRLEAAVRLHDRLVANPEVLAQSALSQPRRQRYRLQFRGEEDSYPKQISYGTLLMEAEHRGDAQLAVHLLESMAAEARSACARSCFLNIAVWEYMSVGRASDAQQLLAQMADAQLLNAVSERLLQKLGATRSSLPMAKLCPMWAERRSTAGDIEKSHFKELSLLQGVMGLRSVDPSAVLAEIEEFGLKRQWIKIAGGEKAAVIETVVAACKPTAVLEYGVYVGYTSMRMALYMRPWRGRVVSMEMDPVHACITRNIALLTGLDDQMIIQIGHSDDAVSCLDNWHGCFDMVFMDQRSTRFHSDLIRLESLGLLRPSCVVVADNVLKPGAPRWLWHICKGVGYRSDIVSVREFGSAETEDWMTVTFLPTDGRKAHVPPEPSGMAALAARADRMRFRTVARNMNDTRRELEDVNRDFRRDFAAFGIRATKIVKTRYDGGGATSEVVCVQGDEEEWTGEDPRLDMAGGKWRTNISHCDAMFPKRL